ncbi:MAG: hypothetical protein ACI9KE_003165 [Polyangiales bacterium]
MTVFDLRLVSLAALLAVVGCSPSWLTLVQSGPPSALAGAPAFDVAFDFSRMIIDGQPVEQLMHTMPPDEHADLEGAFVEMQRVFLEELAAQSGVPVQQANGPPAPGTLRLTVIFTMVQRGPRGPIGFSSTEVTSEAQWSLNGQLTDRASMTRTSSPSFLRPRVAQRMKICAGELAGLTARFFESEQNR